MGAQQPDPDIHTINRRAFLRAGILAGGILTGAASAGTAVFARTAQPSNGTAPDQRAATRTKRGRPCARATAAG